jgi:hypothetical protein
LADEKIKGDNEVKTRFSPILMILVIIAAAMLSRFVGDSDYLLAQTSGGYGYKFFYCPYNKAPYTNPNSPYRTAYTDPNRRFPSPYKVYLPKQYPCPCTTPAIGGVLQDDER